MADEPLTEEETPEPEEEPSDEEVIAQAERPDAVRRALQAEREAAKKARKEAEELAARVKEFEDRDKTESEKQVERLAQLEAKLSPLEQENLRLRVAIEKKLPPELTDRLRGQDREELEADADELLALVTKTNAPRGDVDQGARKGGNKQLSREDLQSMTSAEIVKAQAEGRLAHVLAGET